MTGWRIAEIWITWIKYCWYRFIALIVLVTIVLKMFDTYTWWIRLLPILSIYKFYPYLSKMFFFWEKENGCFFFTSVVWTTIHHTALKNHRMYRVLQHSLNLIFNIKHMYYTTLLCWYLSCLNQTCLIITTALLWTHIRNNNLRKSEKILQGEKTGVLLFMNSVHIIMYNTSRSYLNGLIIIIIFFQQMLMDYVQNSHVK